MNGWSIAVIVMISLDVGIALAKHGEPRTKYNFWASLISSLILTAILYKAGLWH